MPWHAGSWQHRLERRVREICGTANVLGFYVAADYRGNSTIHKGRIAGGVLTSRGYSWEYGTEARPPKAHVSGRPALAFAGTAAFFEDLTDGLSGAKTVVALVRTNIWLPNYSDGTTPRQVVGNAADAAPELTPTVNTATSDQWTHGTVYQDGSSTTDAAMYEAEAHMVECVASATSSGRVWYGGVPVDGTALGQSRAAWQGPVWFALWLSIELTDSQRTQLYRAVRLAYRKVVDVDTEARKAAEAHIIAPNAFLIAPFRTRTADYYAQDSAPWVIQTPISNYRTPDGYYFKGGSSLSGQGLCKYCTSSDLTISTGKQMTMIFRAKINAWNSWVNILACYGTAPGLVRGNVIHVTANGSNPGYYGMGKLGVDPVNSTVSADLLWHTYRWELLASGVGRLYRDGELILTSSAMASTKDQLIEFGRASYHSYVGGTNPVWQEGGNFIGKNFFVDIAGLTSEQIAALEAWAATD